MSIFNRDEDDGISRGERAMLVLPDLTASKSMRSNEARLDEAAGLAAAIGIDVVGRKAVRVRAPRPASLFGKGQAEEIAQSVEESNAKLLIVDASLTPVQQKTLEEMKVMGRK